MLIAGHFDHKIRRLDLGTSAVTTVAGTGAAGALDGPLGANALSAPAGIDVDAALGVAYFAEYAGQTIRQLNLTALSVTTLAGAAGAAGFADGVGAAARFNGGHFLVVDPRSPGALFFADTGNHAIRRIDAAGGGANSASVATLAGAPPPAGAAGAADGVGTSARLNAPNGAAFDRNPASPRYGWLFIAEYTGCRVRLISPAAAVSTLAGGAACAAFAPGVGAAAAMNRLAGIWVADGGHAMVAAQDDGKLIAVAPDGAAGRFFVVATAGGGGGRQGSAAPRGQR